MSVHMSAFRIEVDVGQDVCAPRPRKERAPSLPELERMRRSRSERSSYGSSQFMQQGVGPSGDMIPMKPPGWLALAAHLHVDPTGADGTTKQCSPWATLRQQQFEEPCASRRSIVEALERLCIGVIDAAEPYARLRTCGLSLGSSARTDTLGKSINTATIALAMECFIDSSPRCRFSSYFGFSPSAVSFNITLD